MADGSLPASHGLCKTCEARIEADERAAVSDVERTIEETQRRGQAAA
jgi:predicted nucleic acid-binding Zn ribbon protein